MSTTFTPPPNVDFVPAPLNIPPASAAPAKPAAAPAAPPVAPPSQAEQAGQKQPPPSIAQNLASAAEKHFADKPAAAKPADAAPPVAPAAKTDATPPAKADAAPVTDADPFAHIKPEDGMSEKSLTGWKALKTEATQKVRDAEKKYSEAMAQLETYKKATPAQTEDAERLKAELKQAKDALTVYDLRHDPDFTRQFSEPKKNALREAGEIITYNGKEGVDLNAILEMPLKDFNAKVSELTKDMNGMDATTVQSALRQAHKLTFDEKGALAKAGELKQQIEAKRALVARQAFEEGKNEFASRIPELAIPEGADESKVAEVNAYNQARAEALAEAEKFTFGKMSEREVAGIATRAASLNLMAHHVLPAVQRDLKTATALNAQLVAELTAIKKGKNSPGFNEGASPQKGPDYSKLPPEKMFDAMATAHFGRG